MLGTTYASYTRYRWNLIQPATLTLEFLASSKRAGDSRDTRGPTYCMGQRTTTEYDWVSRSNCVTQIKNRPRYLKFKSNSGFNYRGRFSSCPPRRALARVLARVQARPPRSDPNHNIWRILTSTSNICVNDTSNIRVPLVTCANMRTCLSRSACTRHDQEDLRSVPRIGEVVKTFRIRMNQKIVQKNKFQIWPL